MLTVRNQGVQFRITDPRQLADLPVGGLLRQPRNPAPLRSRQSHHHHRQSRQSYRCQAGRGVVTAREYGATLRDKWPDRK